MKSALVTMHPLKDAEAKAIVEAGLSPEEVVAVSEHLDTGLAWLSSGLPGIGPEDLAAALSEDEVFLVAAPALASSLLGRARAVQAMRDPFTAPAHRIAASEEDPEERSAFFAHVPHPDDLEPGSPAEQDILGSSLICPWAWRVDWSSKAILEFFLEHIRRQVGPQCLLIQVGFMRFLPAFFSYSLGRSLSSCPLGPASVLEETLSERSAPLALPFIALGCGDRELGAVLRLAYRRGLFEALLDPMLAPPNPAIGAADREAFKRWVQAPDPAVPLELSRLEIAVIETLSRTPVESGAPYGALESPAAKKLMASAEKAGLRAGGAPTRFTRLAMAPARSARSSRPNFLPIREDDWARRAPGINVVGYLGTVSGVGNDARSRLPLVQLAGIPHDVTFLRAPHSPMLDTIRWDGSTLAHRPVKLMCVNADEFPRVRDDLGDAFFRDSYVIGLWAWETEHFPERFRGSISLVEEIWVPSSFAARSISAWTEKPVVAVPPFAMLAQAAPGAPYCRALKKVPAQACVFLFVFDYLSVFERKNPLALVEAFRNGPGSDPSGSFLVIKSVNHQAFPEQRARLREAVGGLPNCLLIEEPLPRQEVEALFARCDVYVSLHRAEGFGLTLAEAMSAGKCVIATGYSGNMDFMSPANSLLVDFRLTTVPAGCEPYVEGSVWAEPDVEHAASLMELAAEHPEVRKELGRAALADMQRFNDPSWRVAILRDRYERALMTLGAPPPRAPRLRAVPSA